MTTVKQRITIYLGIAFIAAICLQVAMLSQHEPEAPIPLKYQQAIERHEVRIKAAQETPSYHSTLPNVEMKNLKSTIEVWRGIDGPDLVTVP